MKTTHIESKLWTDLTDEQSEKVVGGVGRIHDDAEGGFGLFGAGFYGWFGGPNHMAPEDWKGLLNAGFLPGTENAHAAGAVSVPGSKS